MFSSSFCFTHFYYFTSTLSLKFTSFNLSVPITLIVLIIRLYLFKAIFSTHFFFYFSTCFINQHPAKFLWLTHICTPLFSYSIDSTYYCWTWIVEHWKIAKWEQFFFSFNQHKHQYSTIIDTKWNHDQGNKGQGLFIKTEMMVSLISFKVVEINTLFTVRYTSFRLTINNWSD